LVSGVYVGLSRDVIWDVESGRPVDNARLLAAAGDLARSEAWEPSAERIAERARLLFRVAERTPPGSDRDRLYHETAAAFERAVSLGPAQPHSWAMLAVLRRYFGDTAGAARAYRLSLLAGAFDPQLTEWRLRLGFDLLPSLDRETVSALQRQIRLAWVVDPGKVTTLSQASPEAASLIRNALDGLSEGDLDEYARRHGGKTDSR